MISIIGRLALLAKIGSTEKDALTNLSAFVAALSGFLIAFNEFWPIAPQLLKVAEFLPIASMILLGSASGKISNLRGAEY